MVEVFSVTLSEVLLYSTPFVIVLFGFASKIRAMILVGGLGLVVVGLWSIGFGLPFWAGLLLSFFGILLSYWGSML